MAHPHRRFRRIVTSPYGFYLKRWGYVLRVSDAIDLWYERMIPYHRWHTMARESITFRIDGDLLDEIDEEAEEEGVSRSEYIRQILHNRRESDILGEEVDTLEERIEAREGRIRELEQQLARRSQLESKIEDLPDKISDIESEPSPPFFVEWVRWFRRR